MFRSLLSSSFSYLPFRDLKPAWWIRINTEIPACTYYFGPFENRQDAEVSQWGYVDDLRHEGASNITTRIEKGCPEQLTIEEDKS